MSDNRHFDLTGVALDKSLDVAFGDYKATGWADAPSRPEDRSVEAVWGASAAERRLVLFWADHPNATPLPAPMGAVDAEPFIRSWLAVADYGTQPDHDGDNEKGWRVYNEAWGYVGGSWQAFVAIEPVWLMYGK